MTSSAVLDPVSVPSPARTAWQFDAAHSEVGFSVRHLMISTVRGRFGGVTGTVTTSGDDFATASVEIAIDPSTIDTGEPGRDAHLRSADFFDVDRFPTLRFTSRRVQTTGDGHFSLEGDLTIHGVTQPVTLDVRSEGRQRDPWGSERAGFTASGVISRAAFGLEWNQALETGGVLVSDQVRLVIEAQLIRQA